MNHDSQLLSHATSNIESLLLEHPPKPHLHSTFLQALRNKTNESWIMIHKSWIIPPLTLTRTLSLLPRSIPESFIVIGQAMCEPIAVIVLETDPPPTPPFIPTPAAPAGLFFSHLHKMPWKLVPNTVLRSWWALNMKAGRGKLKIFCYRAAKSISIILFCFVWPGLVWWWPGRGRSRWMIQWLWSGGIESSICTWYSVLMWGEGGQKSRKLYWRHLYMAPYYIPGGNRATLTVFLES